jgi:hypothetical protein
MSPEDQPSSKPLRQDKWAINLNAFRAEAFTRKALLIM